MMVVRRFIQRLGVLLDGDMEVNKFIELAGQMVNINHVVKICKATKQSKGWNGIHIQLVDNIGLQEEYDAPENALERFKDIMDQLND